jgi:hypothetical protein
MDMISYTPSLYQAVKQNEQTLSNLKALNAEQEKDVQRVRQRDTLLKKVCCFVWL